MSKYKRTPSNNFYGEMTDLLLQYSDEIQDEVNEAVKVTADYAKKELRVAGNFQDRTGKYRKGWKIQYVLERLGAFATIYNGKYYPLTHLLESGHSKWLWGRQTGESVQAFPHIEAVNEEAQRMLEEEVARRIVK